MIQWPDIKNIESERLIFRKVRREDTESYYRNLGSSEAVCRGLLFNPHSDISESVASVQKVLRRYAEGRCYRWAVTEQGSDELIGIIELLRFDESDCSCSFAYMLTQRLWGRGYGTEMLRTVFRFAFREMGVQVIRADHFADNPASGGCMRKAGMRCIGVEEVKYVKNGNAKDAVLYEITRDEFQ